MRRVRKLTWTAVLAVTASVSGMLVTAAPAGALPSEVAVFFASPTDSEVVVIAGGHRTSLEAFPTAQVLAGHFHGTSAFLYNPGPGPDGLVTVDDDGESLSTHLVPMSVAGRYRPVVLDADQDGIDDIFWYAPGAADDHLWRFAADGSVTSIELHVDGSYVPIPFVLEGGSQPDRQALIFYGRGRVADHLWVFGSNGLPAIVHGAVRIDGDYRPVVGHFEGGTLGGHDQIFWYERNGGRSFLWLFSKGGGTAHASLLAGRMPRGYQPSAASISWAGFDVIFWYAPGPGVEQLSFWSDGKMVTGEASPINGNYRQVLDGQGRNPLETAIFLGPGSAGREVQLDPEDAPVLYTITPIPDLPPNPIGAHTPHTPPADT